MDKNVYKSDKHLEDRGWQAMQELLDREMPVERRRRPGFFWLFGLLLCLATAYVVWQAWPAEPAQRISRPSAPVAGLVDPSVAASKSPQQPQQTVQAPTFSDQKAVSINPALQISEPRQTTIYPAQPQKPEASQAQITPDRENFIPETISATTPAPANPATAEKTLAENPEQNEPATNATLATAQPPTDPLAASPELPPFHQPLLVATNPPAMINPAETAKRPVDPATADTVAQADQPAPIEPVNPKPLRPWAFGATVGLLTSPGIDYSGTNLGLSVEWQPARRWGLRGSLLYQFQKLQKEQRTILEVSSGSYVLLTGDQTALDVGGSTVVNNPAPNSLATPVYVPVSRLHRLEVPVNAFWQPLRKWRVYGGLSMGLNLYAQTGRQTLKNNRVLNVPSGEANRNLNQEITRQLPDWDMRWNVGIGFKPNRHLTFELFVQNPLHLLPRNTNPAYFDFTDQKSTFESYGQQVATSRPAIGDQTLFQISASAFF